MGVAFLLVTFLWPRKEKSLAKPRSGGETPSRTESSCHAWRSRAIHTWGGIRHAMPLPTPHPSPLPQGERGEGSKPKSLRLAGEIPSGTESSCPARRSRAIEAWGGIRQAMTLPTPHPSPLPQGERGQIRNPVEDGVLVSCMAKPCHSHVGRHCTRQCRYPPLTLALSPKGRGDKAETPSRTAPSCPAWRSHAIEAWDDIAPGNAVTDPSP